jgi:glycosyltransferase involved in cell wall biosynthesis
MIKYSVIIPAYNRANVIRRAIGSILNQEYDKDEVQIVVVDGCSEDNIQEVVSKHYLNRILRDKYCVKLVSLDKHSGRPGIVRNFGVKQSSGKYLCFCDSDDRWLSNHLLVVDRELTKNPELEFIKSQPEN